ncbi:unnamed protein product [Phytophthora fragariaefolia]|uniref:Unnamed protein product n=1 Tax=Phytophthora fragariaefolia TaxID=1490495 RepID=A0A9W6XCW3_9STRA|nr:unnamed protein product [Phytophthora fragariaefolia]
MAVLDLKPPSSFFNETNTKKKHKECRKATDASAYVPERLELMYLPDSTEPTRAPPETSVPSTHEPQHQRVPRRAKRSAAPKLLRSTKASDIANRGSRKEILRTQNDRSSCNPNLIHFVATIAKISTSYAQRQASITRGLRRKKQRPPRIELPTAPDLSTFEVPPESDDDDYEGEEVVLDSSIDAESNESSNMDDINEVLTSGNVETAENLAQNILENTGNHDFSLEWEGDESCSESSDSDS